MNRDTPSGFKLKFLGADRQVTGSCTYVEADGKTFIVDCGLFQEREYLSRNWQPFAFDPRRLDFVLLTHAHLDHCGLLPKLVKEGFRGRILATEATRELLPIVLEDSAHLQEEDAAYKKKRHAREGRTGPYPEAPLYTVEDARRVLALVEAVAYRRPLAVGRNLDAVFHDAGHILGSAMVEVRLGDSGGVRNLLFTGDLGQWDKPIVKNPAVFDQVDALVLESTYGGTDHQDPESLENMLHSLVGGTAAAGGNVLIPTFALERAQEVLYAFGILSSEQRLPSVPVFLDSPMAVEVTAVFERHVDVMDRRARALFRSGGNPFRFPELRLVKTIGESKALNSRRDPFVVLAGSGMCTGGRIKHHLLHNVGRPESLVLFVGYQARGTLGRQILDGQPAVRIHGQTHPLRARVAQLHGFSAHAGQSDIMRWLRYLRREPKIFLKHGEEDKAAALASAIEAEFGWTARISSYLEDVELG
jgi:metallo-beta-lactamase family protein